MTRLAVVTGAASGIGAAIATMLVESGWMVASLDLQTAPTTHHSAIADVSDAKSVCAAMQSIQDWAGPVDALVTAAGHYQTIPVAEIRAAEWNRMLSVHLGGLRTTTEAVLPRMLDRGSGSIVAITSELAIGGGDGDAHYAAAKGCIIGFVRSLALEVAGRGVRVNAVAPGPTDTPLLPVDSPWRTEEHLSTLPIGRLCRPDEVAQTVRFLLEEADYCVGEVFSPNSGAVI